MGVLRDDRSGPRLRLLDSPFARRSGVETSSVHSPAPPHAPRLGRGRHRFQPQKLLYRELKSVLIADVDQLGLIIGDSRDVRRTSDRALLDVEPIDRALQNVAFVGELLKHPDIAAGGRNRRLIAGDHLVVDEAVEGTFGDNQVFGREVEIVDRDDYVAPRPNFDGSDLGGRFFSRLLLDRQPSCGLRRRADGEVRDLLLLAVIEQLEIRTLQIARQLALFVCDDGVDLNQFGFDAKQRLVLFLFSALALLPLDRDGNLNLPVIVVLFPFSPLLLRMGRISTASGSERGSINKPIYRATLATARGTDPVANSSMSGFH